MSTTWFVVVSITSMALRPLALHKARCRPWTARGRTGIGITERDFFGVIGLVIIPTAYFTMLLVPPFCVLIRVMAYGAITGSSAATHVPAALGADPAGAEGVDLDAGRRCGGHPTRDCGGSCRASNQPAAMLH